MDPALDVAAAYDALAETVFPDDRTATRERALLEAFAAAIPAGAHVLDAGCGAGVPAAARLATDATVVGLDASRPRIHAARRRVSGIHAVQGDLRVLPFVRASFDAVVSLRAVSHVARSARRAVLTEFRRVLRPGGRLLVTLARSLSDGSETGDGGVRPDHAGLQGLFRDADFAIARAELVGEDCLFVRADAA